MIGHAGRHGIETDVIQVVEAGEVGPLEAEGNLISADTTFYVATTGSDTTGDGSSGSPWATLRKALSYLDEYRILGSAKVTISIAKGKYTETSQVPVNHPILHKGAMVMKIDVNQKIKTLEGGFFKDGDGVTDITLKKVLVRALVLAHTSDEKLSGDEKFNYYKLAMKITDADGEIDVTPEEIIILKKRVGLMYATQMVGPVFMILNG